MSATPLEVSGFDPLLGYSRVGDGETPLRDPEGNDISIQVLDRRGNQVPDAFGHLVRLIQMNDCREWWVKCVGGRIRKFQSPPAIIKQLPGHYQICTREGANAEKLFEGDFLNADAIRARSPDDYPTESDFAEQKADFAKRWILDAMNLRLDREQVAAIIARERNVLVRARAGSGKTRTLVCRVVFLIKHCRVDPSEILVVAFNKKAVAEIVERLKKHLDSALPHVMTFHALAHAIVHPKESLVYDDDAGSKAQSREVQNVIDRLLTRPEAMDRVRSLMLQAFREDWEAIVRGRHDKSVDDYLEYRRFVAKETLGGDYVKSYGERLIANVLFEHDIRYKYEESHRWREFFYRPDFTVWQGNRRVIIEYFGMEGDEDYDSQSKQKEEYCSSRGIELIKYTRSDVAGDPLIFAQKLVTNLRALGFTANLLPEEEIWTRIKDRAIDSFTNAVKQFVVRCRKLRYSEQELKHLIATHTFLNESEHAFANIAAVVHREYERSLDSDEKDDFDGLMWRAADHVSKGTKMFSRKAGIERGDIDKLRFVLVDEYQDFSVMFDSLITAIRRANDKIELFCVGDDWQAINRFAGSDATYFTQFSRRHQAAIQVDVITNYRSRSSIVSVGNLLMKGLGNPARSLQTQEAGKCELAYVDKFVSEAAEQLAHGSDEVSAALLRILTQYIDKNLNVTLLARKNTLPWRVGLNKSHGNVSDLLRFQEHLRNFFPKEVRHRISASTIHGFKGNESDVVVILDAVKGACPFIHPHWFFNRVFGDNLAQLTDDERRLFYVAVSRAKRRLILLTESGRESEYIKELQKLNLSHLDWSKLPLPEYESGNGFVVEVKNGYDVKTELKKRGFKFDDRQSVWRKIFDASGAEAAEAEAKDLSEMGVEPRIIDSAGQQAEA